MKNTMMPFMKLGLFALLMAALAYSSTAVAKRPGPGGGCPRDILCTDVWDPVICSNGQVYSNGCYAYRDCATGCVPYDDGGPVEAIGKGGCPRDINCPDVYNPVTCSNGVTYPNACYAYRACATGCGAT